MASNRNKLITDSILDEWMEIEKNTEKFGMWMVRCQSREPALAQWVGWMMNKQLQNVRDMVPNLFAQVPMLATVISSTMAGMFWRGMYFGERRYYMSSEDMFIHPEDAPDPLVSDLTTHKEETLPPPFGPESFQ